MNRLFFLLPVLAIFMACSPKIGQEIPLAPPALPDTLVVISPHAPEIPEPPLVPPPPVEEESFVVDEANLVASIEKLPCYGKCPVYELKVYNDGKVTFNGKAFVDKIGKYYAVVDKKEIVEIMVKAESIGFLNFKDEYPDPAQKTMYDFPVTVLFLKMEGQEKRIRSRHEAPTPLWQYEQLFQDRFLELDWKRAKN